MDDLGIMDKVRDIKLETDDLETDAVISIKLKVERQKAFYYKEKDKAHDKEKGKTNSKERRQSDAESYVGSLTSMW